MGAALSKSSLYTGEVGLTPPMSLKEGTESEPADSGSSGVRGGTTPACAKCRVPGFGAQTTIGGDAARRALLARLVGREPHALMPARSRTTLLLSHHPIRWSRHGIPAASDCHFMQSCKALKPKPTARSRRSWIASESRSASSFVSTSWYRSACVSASSRRPCSSACKQVSQQQQG